MEKAHLKLLPLLLAHLLLAHLTCSCCPRVTIFTSGKSKTGTCDYRSQVHAAPPILGGKTGTRDRYICCWHTSSYCPRVTIFTSGKAKTYTPRFIFWCRVSYFGWENWYLRPARSQVHAGLHILGRKTGTCDRPDSAPHIFVG